MAAAPMMILALSLAGPAARAEDPTLDPPSHPEAPPDASRLPSVIEAVSAPYPEDALAQRLEAEVLLEVEISDAGDVLAARVIQPAGHGFDEAAQEAMLSFRFSPALDRKGRPVPATIQYLYRFRLDALPVVSVEGQVQAAGTREGLGGLRVVATGPDGSVRTAITAEDGSFQMVDLAPGTWVVDAAGPGTDPERVEVEVLEGRVAQLRIFLRPTRPWEARGADEELVVEGTRIEPEVTERALDADELRVMPGTGGDIVRAVQSLPGMARSPFSAGQLLVRGTGPDDSGFYLGGSRIPLVFHFGGLSTVINADSLGEVVFLPGNYGVRYGRTLGGVVDLRTNPDLPERSRGYLSVDLFQTTLFVEQKAGERTAVTLSGRRSYIDAILAPIIATRTEADIQLPRYADLQGRVLHRTKSDHELDFLLFVSDDRARVEDNTEDGEDDVDTDSHINLSFQKLWARWRAPLGSGWESEQALIIGPEKQELEFLEDETAFDRSFAIGMRSEFNRPVPAEGNIGWRLGLDSELRWQEFEFEIEDFGGYSLFGPPEDGSAFILKPGAYVEQTQRAGRLEGVPGIRFDAMVVKDRYELEEYQAVSIDPRLALRYELGPSTRLHGTVGRYSQFPQLREVLEDSNGNPDLVPEWALATSAGIRQQVGPMLSVEATLYHSWLYDLIVGHEDRFEFTLGPLRTGDVDTGEYSNEGRGRIYGLETLVRLEDRRTTAWIGLTLSRSLRTPRGADEEIVYKYDQPVVGTAVISHALPRNWQVGGRFRYGSGNPYQPVANRVYDLESHAWVPIFEDEETKRIPAFWTLDLRVDRSFVFRRWTLTTYLDLMNATNRRNQELVHWTADYSQEVPVYGLPIIPAFGLRGAW